MSDPGIRLVRCTRRPWPTRSGPERDILVVTPVERLPLLTVRESVLWVEGEILSYKVTSKGNLKLVVRSLARTRKLLEESQQLPDLLRCLPRA